MRLQLVTTADPQPDYLDFPLHQPLAQWDHPQLVRIPVGIHRHVVRFVEREGRLYALKELPRELAAREYRLLRHLADDGLPVVEVMGVIAERGPGLEDILITRHLEFSLPFRFLFDRSGLPRLKDALIDALAVLLVRIHLAGFWWGDCSLSNTLFRRDAGSLSAWLVDTETGELHERLSDGQRTLDLDIAQVNILGGLLDLQESGRLTDDLDPTDLITSLRQRYDQLWAELTAAEVFDVTERHLIDQRLNRLNEMGFDTTEISIEPSGDANAVVFKPVVVEAGHHAKELERLTGLVALENQARRLLNDIRSYRAWLSADAGRDVPEAIGVAKWLIEVFDQAIQNIPAELRNKREPAELFHEILLHRDELAATRADDVPVPAAAISYSTVALPFAETERAVVEADD